MWTDRPAVQYGALLLTAFALLSFWNSLITDAPIDKDAAENLQMALNLEQTGVISDDESEIIDPSRRRDTPTMDREPLPAVSGLLMLHVVNAIRGPAARAEYFQGERARLLKFQNVAWLALLSVAAFLICRQLGLSFAVSLAGVIASNLLLLNSGYRNCMLDSLVTESAAAALLALGSYLLARAFAAASVGGAALAGLCFGLLTLVKAAFLYVTLALVVLLPVVAWLTRRSLRAASLQAISFAVLAALVVLPWMLRNEARIGYFGLAGRGGEVSHNRAIMDLMTKDEMIGAIYVWAPYPFNGPLRRLLGYSRTDLQAGGRLQRLNDDNDTSFAASDALAERAGRPDEAISFYRKGRAEMFALINQFKAEGNPQPYMAADKVLKERTSQIVLHHPLRHAALTLLSLWRAAFICFPVLAVGLIYAVRRHAGDLMMLILPPLLMVMLYAVGSYYEPRYSMPTYPIVVCLLTLATQRLIRGRQVPAT